MPCPLCHISINLVGLFIFLILLLDIHSVTSILSLPISQRSCSLLSQSSLLLALQLSTWLQLNLHSPRFIHIESHILQSVNVAILGWTQVNTPRMRIYNDDSLDFLRVFLQKNIKYNYDYNILPLLESFLHRFITWPLPWAWDFRLAVAWLFVRPNFQVRLWFHQHLICINYRALLITELYISYPVKIFAWYY